MASLRTALGDIRDNMNAVKARSGKSAWQQMREIRRFHRQATLCGSTDYFRFGVYDETYVSPKHWSTFLGWRDQRGLSLALNPRRVVLPGWDKLAFHAIARNFGIPVPAIRAFFQGGTRATAEAVGRPLGTPRELRKFLLEEADYPLFLKPSWGGEGIRTTCIDAVDRREQYLVLHGERRIDIDAFVSDCVGQSDRWRFRAEHGLLLQEVLRPDPAMVALFALRFVPGVRVVSLVDDNRAQVHRAVCKVPMGDNVIDNFALGETGNLTVAIDVASGRFGHGIRGILPKGEIVRRIPEAARAFEGEPVPGWERICDIVARGASAFPLMRIQHWDVALTDRGPVALELNDLGGTEILQIHGIGLLTEPLRSHLRRHGDPSVREWVARMKRCSGTASI